jgi:hypothetical protein
MNSSAIDGSAMDGSAIDGWAMIAGSGFSTVAIYDDSRSVPTILHSDEFDYASPISIGQSRGSGV